MKKLFTLLLLAIVAVGAYADGLTTVLIGETALNWGDAVKIPAGSLKGIQSGDYIYFTTTASSLKLQYWDGSTTQSIESATSPYEVSEAMATALQSNDLSIQAGTENKIYYLGFGPSSLGYDSGTSLAISDGGGDQTIQLTDAIKSSCKIFDKIVFTVEPKSEGTTTLNVKHNSGNWEIYYTVPSISSKTDVTWVIDEIALANAKAGALWVGEGGNSSNFKVTAIKYYSCTTDNTILLEPSVKSYIQLGSIPSNATVKYDRAFQWGWNTLCLPFEATVTDIHSTAKAYEFTAANASSITFTQITGTTLEAGKPYLVYVDTNVATSATFTGVNVTATSAGSTSEINGLTFKGNYVAGFDMTGKYGVAYHNDSDDSKDGWYIMKGGNDATGKAFSAYFEGTVPTISGGARGFSIITDDGTTKINTVEKVEEGDGEIYNLMGVRTSAPRKGLYIKNGKKYIVK